MSELKSQIYDLIRQNYNLAFDDDVLKKHDELLAYVKKYNNNAGDIEILTFLKNKIFIDRIGMTK